MTAGFYKIDNGTMLYAQNYVLSAEYELRAETREQYTYPCDGWKWFEYEDAAYLEYGIKKPDENDKYLPDSEQLP